MIKRIELEKTVSSLQSELGKATKALNKSIAIDNNTIELYTDGIAACLKLYYNGLELSIVFQKHINESEYNGNNRFITNESEVFNSNGETLKPFVNAIQIDNTKDLLAVLRSIGLHDKDNSND